MTEVHFHSSEECDALHDPDLGQADKCFQPCMKVISDDLSVIICPAGVIGISSVMKKQKDFSTSVVPKMWNILEDQKQWRDSVPSFNQQFVFLQLRNPLEAFFERSLHKLLKNYSPDNAVKGIRHDDTVKGRSGAFNAMCRKFLKSNVIAQMRGGEDSRVRIPSKSACSVCIILIETVLPDRDRAPMAEHYDLSDEILKEKMTPKRPASTVHTDSIMAQVALIKREEYRFKS